MLKKHTDKNIIIDTRILNLFLSKEKRLCHPWCSYYMYFKYRRAMNVQIWIRNGQSINIRCQRNLFLVHIKYVCVCVCLTLKSQIFIINPYTTNRDIRTWILEHLALSTYSLNHHAHYEFHREIFYQTVINSQNFALLTIT